MKVSEQDVLYVADLANLELMPEERGRMVRDLNSILEYVDRLDQLDTARVPPRAGPELVEGVQASATSGALDKKGPAKFEYALRADELGKCLDRKRVIENAPDSDGTFFKVPKVIER
jgi:aspartyl-tRNA(Asn)/glutamyl-tRNA(Gln) amidotransferase subunit C